MSLYMKEDQNLRMSVDLINSHRYWQHHPPLPPVINRVLIAISQSQPEEGYTNWLLDGRRGHSRGGFRLNGRSLMLDQCQKIETWLCAHIGHSYIMYIGTRHNNNNKMIFKMCFKYLYDDIMYSIVSNSVNSTRSPFLLHLMTSTILLVHLSVSLP